MSIYIYICNIYIHCLFPPVDGKRRNLDATELAKIVRQDLVQRQFLATADFTPDRRWGGSWDPGKMGMVIFSDIFVVYMGMIIDGDIYNHPKVDRIQFCRGVLFF